MNAMAFLLLSMTAVIAVIDWIIVSRNNRGAEFLFKPLVMIGLIATTVAMNPSSEFAQFMIIAGLFFSLFGDVCLMVPKDLFLFGLGAFFVAHLFYIVALLALGVSVIWMVAGIALMAAMLGIVGRKVIAGAAKSDASLIVPVAAYMLVLSLMVVSAFGTALFFAIVGALLFAVSDTVLGWTRFVEDFARSRLVVMTTYHLGQVGLVLALV